MKRNIHEFDDAYRLLLKTMLTPGHKVKLVFQNKQKAKNFFNRVKSCYSQLPEFLKPKP